MTRATSSSWRSLYIITSTWNDRLKAYILFLRFNCLITLLTLSHLVESVLSSVAEKVYLLSSDVCSSVISTVYYVKINRGIEYVCNLNYLLFVVYVFEHDQFVNKPVFFTVLA